MPIICLYGPCLKTWAVFSPLGSVLVHWQPSWVQTSGQSQGPCVRVAPMMQHFDHKYCICCPRCVCDFGDSKHKTFFYTFWPLNVFKIFQFTRLSMTCSITIGRSRYLVPASRSCSWEKIFNFETNWHAILGGVGKLKLVENSYNTSWMPSPPDCGCLPLL